MEEKIKKRPYDTGNEGIRVRVALPLKQEIDRLMYEKGFTQVGASKELAQQIKDMRDKLEELEKEWQRKGFKQHFRI